MSPAAAAAPAFVPEEWSDPSKEPTKPGRAPTPWPRQYLAHLRIHDAAVRTLRLAVFALSFLAVMLAGALWILG